MGTPNQHVLSDQPFGELELKSARTTDDIIRRKFVPMLKQLIYGYGFCPFNAISSMLTWPRASPLG